MKNTIFPVFIAIILLFTGCFLGPASTVMVSPVIRVAGMPDASVIDYVTFTVTGADMDRIEVSYSQLPDMINIAVPEGTGRTFELTVGLTSDYISSPAVPYTSYKGIATADVTSDSTIITLNMGIGSTKIIVPDYRNNRVIQFNDISGAGEVKLSTADNSVFSTWLTDNSISTFAPYDVDFDNLGRIYIANLSSSEGIIRVDNIQGANPRALGVGRSIAALSVDRRTSRIFYTDRDFVYSNNLDGTDEIQLSTVGGENIYGLAVDKAGYLYLADWGSDGPPAIKKFDIAQGSLGSFTANISNPWDVMIKDGELFVANLSDVSGYQILVLSTSDMSMIGHYGTYVGDTDNTDFLSGHFYGPRRFAAQLNEEITIIDDSPDWWLNKIIQIYDITGSGWVTYPETGSSDESGQNFFKFFDDTYSGA